jgi:hypothetical protein
MGRFLDQRSSMNSNATGSIAIPVISTPSPAIIQVTRNGVVFYTAQVVITTNILADIRSFTVQDLLAPAAADRL